MIFPTESLQELRGKLEDQVSAGELSEADAYRQALAADPEDPRALRLLALLAEDEDDYATATELSWQWLRADPLSHEAFHLVARMLALDPADTGRAAAYRALGREKLHFDPESDSGPPSGEPLAEPGETAEVARELEPHRLLHEMWTASTGELDRELIDRVLARGPDMAPLLTGILNLYGEDLLDEVDDALVVRALALLGEIGEPSAVGALARFLPLESEAFNEAATWAFQRLAFRRPAEALEQVLLLIPGAGAYDLASLAQEISLMPETPGRAGALLAIERRLAEFEDPERGIIALSLITSTWVMEGLDSPLAARFHQDYADRLPAEARRELKSIRRQLEREGPYLAQAQDVSVHEICCPAFDAADEDQPYVRSGPKLGRNDPCWCGSGQKYKKCHLAADEGR